MMAFVWMDRERRYFLATGSSLEEGAPYVRQRWRQLENDEPPVKVKLVVPQPKACEKYYTCCAKIDQHNRDRQDTLGIERKFRTHKWSLRVNLSLLSICIVNTWRVYSRMTFGDTNEEGGAETQKDFYSYLAAELIDNTYDNRARRERYNQNEPTTPPSTFNNVFSPLIDPRTGLARSGVDIHLTPTTKKRKNQRGEKTNHSFQGRCKVCHVNKTTHECSLCKDDIDNADGCWICHTSTKRQCFIIHCNDVHPY